jgi:hypothetical protein
MAILAKFDGLTLREVEARDRAALDAWIEADPYHQALLDASYFLGQTPEGDADPRGSCYVLEDAEGEVMFIRLSRISRVNIQFKPGRKKADKERTRHALMCGMAFLETHLSRAGAEEWMFETSSPELKKLATRRMGFQASPFELKRYIPLPDEQQGQDGSVLHEQHISPEVL